MASALTGEGSLRRRLVAGVVAVGIGGSALLGLGCGGDKEVKAGRAGTTPVAEGDTPFRITTSWSSLPGRVILSPRHETQEGCETFWTPKQPRPAVSEDPRVVRVDGRCNSPLSSEQVGIYAQPKQAGKPLEEARNGDAVGVECVAEGQWIQDVRGSEGSAKWLGVVTRSGVAGFLPDTNAGFVRTAGLRPC